MVISDLLLLSMVGTISVQCIVTAHIMLLYYYTRSTFVRNAGPNGILSIGYTPVKFSGINRFIENTGASLRVS